MLITRYAIDPLYPPPSGYATSKKTSYDALTELKFEIIFDSAKENSIQEMQKVPQVSEQA